MKENAVTAQEGTCQANATRPRGLTARSKGKRRVGLPQWVSWLVYALLSVLMTWPLARHLGTHLGGSDLDIFNVYWGNWWMRQALASGQNLYMTRYLLYPVGFDLTVFAFSPFFGLLSIPLSWVLSPAAAYNVLVWASIVLCCAAMDQLVRYLTGNPYAALVAGLVFGFAPSLAGDRAAHLNMALVAWIPWAALFMTRLMRQAQVRDAILLAVAIGLSFLTRLQVGVLVLIFCGIYWIGLMLVERKRWPRLAVRRLLLAGLLALALLFPLFVHVWQVFRQSGTESLFREASDMQADLLSYVVPTPQHPILGRWTEAIYKERFPGNVAFYWTFVGVLPLALLIYAGVSRPREALPWLVAGAFFWVLALGTCLRINGHVYGKVRLPYGLAQGLFSAIGFDRPNRFNLAVAPALAVLAGLACDRIASRLGKSWPLFIVAGWILFEYLIVPMPLMALPSDSPFYAQIAADGQGYAVVDLPLTREAGKFHRYYQTVHQKPIVGGWSHRVPPNAFAFIERNPLLRTWRVDDVQVVALPSALSELSRANVRYIILHKDQLRAIPEGMRSLFLTVKPVYEDQSIYVLPTETASQAYGVARRFDEGLELIKPSVILEMDGPRPALSLNTCWLFEGGQGDAWRCRVALIDPDGAVVDEKEAAFLPAGEGLVCQGWSLALSPPYQPGDYRIDVTPLLGERSLGTFTMTRPIQVVQDDAGMSFPLMGVDFPVAFDAPVEMLGYNIETGEDMLWLDLYWRGLADHRQAYVLFVQLLDPVTGEQVVRTSDDVLHELEWKEGQVVHERRVIAINDIPPGQYHLAVGLYPSGEPHRRVAAFDGRSGKRWAGGQAILDRPVLALPLALQGLPVSEEGRIVVYTAAEGAPEAAVHRNEFREVHAHFGQVARLTGYSLQPEEVTASQELTVTLRWEAINAEPVQVDYKVFVHVLDASGRIIAQHDGQPAGGRRPTSTWKKGDPIIDAHGLVWQAQADEGMATIVVGLYDFQTQERLPAYGAGGERVPDDRFLLGQVHLLGAEQ